MVSEDLVRSLCAQRVLLVLLAVSGNCLALYDLSFTLSGQAVVDVYYRGVIKLGHLYFCVYPKAVLVEIVSHDPFYLKNNTVFCTLFSFIYMCFTEVT